MKAFTTFKSLILALTVISASANAGVISSNSRLLDQTGASQLENWIGQGDLDWSSIWYGGRGATSQSWHSAVDGVSHTVSIYDITYRGQNYLIGGYNALAWDSTSHWMHDYDGNWENFIFNLSRNVMHQTSDPAGSYRIGQYAAYNDGNYFAHFGSGNDIHGGRYNIGRYNGYSRHYGTYNGETYSATGNIVDNGRYQANFTVNALETYTFRQAVSVPEPSTLATFAISLIGMATLRARRKFKLHA